MSDAPRTDEVTRDSWWSSSPTKAGDFQMLARDLERELAAANKRATDAEEDRDKLKAFISSLDPLYRSAYEMSECEVRVGPLKSGQWVYKGEAKP